MQEVKIYDFQFNLLASDFKCISFDWDIRFNGVGSFKGVFTLDSPICDACSKNEFTVCIQGENQGIVTDIKLKDDRIIVSGKSMNYILGKRICMPFSNRDYGMEMTETEMASKLVESYCRDFIEVLTPPQQSVAREYVRTEARPLVEIVCEILDGANCGHYVKFDVENKKWVFGCMLPGVTDMVLSKPDNTLESCDYTREINNYAICGVYKQKAKFMGSWDAFENEPVLRDQNPDNFAKVYYVSTPGTQFGIDFKQGMFAVCQQLSGRIYQVTSYEDFWFKVYAKDDTDALKWECILPCEDIEEAAEALALKVITENVSAITRGSSQKELKVGDVLEIRLTGGENAMVFTRQVKRIRYHYEWGNCYVKPEFYKMKENEDEL